jgi:hypothetical protein
MRLSSFIKVCCQVLLPVAAALVLSGCIKGLMGGELLSPEVIKVTVPTEKVKPAVRDVPPEKPAETVPAGGEKNVAPPEASPAVDEKLLPRELPAQAPEGLMPVPPPAPPLPASPQSKSDNSRADGAGSRKPVVPAGKPDFSYRDETLTEDVAWHGEVLVEGGVTVAPQATLTVEAGTVVRFRSAPADSGTGAVLLVQGRILANGSNGNPVVFTSNFEEPQAGDWQGMVLLASEKKNLLEHCRLEGAETGLDAAFSRITVKNTFFVKCRTGARVQDSLLVMTGSGASNCAIGLNLFDSEADIREADFSSNRRGIAAARASLYLAGSTLYGNDFEAVTAENSRVRIVGNSFTLNGSGASLTACEGAVSANRILKNSDYGLLLARSRVKANGNEIVQNGKIGMRVEDGSSVAWGNILFANGSYDLYNAGNEEYRAIGNWWGKAPLTDIGRRIYDQRTDNGRGRVLYLPVLRDKPPTAQ